MECFERVASDVTTRRPEFLSDEVELMVCASVSVLDEEKKVLLEVGVVRLTSHRLLWMSDANETAFALHLRHVLSVESHMSGFYGLRTPQIKVVLQQARVVRVNFASSGRDQMLDLWNSALKRRVWETKPVEKEAFRPDGAGISGLLRKAEERSVSEAKSLNEAFSDMDALVKSADQLVQIAKKLQKVALGAEANEASTLLSDMGLISAISKDNCGSLFHEELARSLCGWLLGSGSRLMKSGMASLTDVYCAYNRARGTSLISPQDLYRAAVLMDELSLPLQLHEFASGVRVLKQRGQENALESRIRALFADKKPRTALEVCEALSVSMSVTMEELKALEQSAFLCRDEAISGVTFYFNPWKQEQKAV